MTTMVIEPIYSDNRSEDGAYGCACVCNSDSNTYNFTADYAAAQGACGCSCVGAVNSNANSDLASKSA